MLKLSLIKPGYYRCLIMCLCVPALLPGRGVAQRGADYSANDPAPKTPVSDFPGFFDSYTVPEGSFVADLPSLALDYGVNDNLTLGINGISALSVVFMRPVGLGKVRYRFFSNGRVQSSLTGYFGGAHVRLDEKDGSTNTLAAVLLGGTSNTLFHVSDKGVVNLSLFGAQTNFTYSTPTDVKYQRVQFGLFYAAVGYEYFVSRTLGLSALIFRQVIQNVTSESVNFISSQSNLGTLTSKQVPITFKLTADIAPSSRQFLLSPAFLGSFTPETGALTYSPFLNFSFKM